ncbi:MAG TPA: DeoR/GlpR family DNA-binding transcription regulator [Terracidiphilus sp.]|nr:DeoR/GlpR family DNA-binding transcription regulator [Terracidiphilus sp.]
MSKSWAILFHMKVRSDELASRHETILQILQSAGSITTENLCDALQTSIATVRRDLKELEDRSLLRRTRGGAVTMGPLFYEPFRHDSSFQDKVGSFADEKRRIARAAAHLVKEGDTVALSGGTTTTEVVRSLMTIRGITVITNTVNVAMELSACKDIEVVVTGGVLRGNWFTLVGPLANIAAGMVYADIMFLGVDGISAQLGLFCENSQEAEYLRLMAQHAKRKVVVTDHSKIGNQSHWVLCPAGEVSTIITDTGADDSSIAPFQALGIEVIRV